MTEKCGQGQVTVVSGKELRLKRRLHSKVNFFRCFGICFGEDVSSQVNRLMKKVKALRNFDAMKRVCSIRYVFFEDVKRTNEAQTGYRRIHVF